MPEPRKGVATGPNHPTSDLTDHWPSPREGGPSSPERTSAGGACLHPGLSGSCGGP